MEETLKKIIEIEKNAHALIDKANEEKENNIKACEDELKQMRENKFKEADTELKILFEKDKENTNAQITEKNAAHEKKCKLLKERYSANETKITEDMFSKIISV